MSYLISTEEECHTTQQFDRSLYFNKTQLKAQGWKDCHISEFLSQPDRTRRNGRECLYIRSRVQTVFNSDTFPRAEVESVLQRRESRRNRKQLAEIELLTQAHPTVPRNQIEKVVSEKKRIYRDQELGYNTGVATATYWRQLGYQPNQPVWWYGYAVEESNLAPVYSKSALQEVDDERSPDDVWADYYNRHGSREIALAEILRFSNRLQKVIRHPGFYLLKDYWITLNQEYLREGRISRQERKECWSCNGTGQFRYDSCRKCDGTGVYSKRKLYEHRFDIQGREYCFHSYREPQNITDTPGADLGFYGGAFQASELPLPPQSLLVRAVRIGLVEIFGGPVPEADVRRNERWRYSIFWSEE